MFRQRPRPAPSPHMSALSHVGAAMCLHQCEPGRRQGNHCNVSVVVGYLVCFGVPMHLCCRCAPFVTSSAGAIVITSIAVASGRHFVCAPSLAGAILCLNRVTSGRHLFLHRLLNALKLRGDTLCLHQALSGRVLACTDQCRGGHASAPTPVMTNRRCVDVCPWFVFRVVCVSVIVDSVRQHWCLPVVVY